jgi:hypothetical protein
MLPKVILITIATAFTTLPATAVPVYTSSAPAIPISSIRELDSTPVLLRRESDSSIYGSNGFVSNVAADRNIYVERVFVANFNEGNRTVSLVTWSQIDCGRMLHRALRGSLEVDGVTTKFDSTEWKFFNSSSVFGETCEKAASDRGITWRWE